MQSSSKDKKRIIELEKEISRLSKGKRSISIIPKNEWKLLHRSLDQLKNIKGKFTITFEVTYKSEGIDGLSYYFRHGDNRVSLTNFDDDWVFEHSKAWQKLDKEYWTLQRKFEDIVDRICDIYDVDINDIYDKLKLQ